MRGFVAKAEECVETDAEVCVEVQRRPRNTGRSH
jgi:hypothetical protein